MSKRPISIASDSGDDGPRKKVNAVERRRRRDSDFEGDAENPNLILEDLNNYDFDEEKQSSILNDLSNYEFDDGIIPSLLTLTAHNNTGPGQSPLNGESSKKNEVSRAENSDEDDDKENNGYKLPYRRRMLAQLRLEKRVPEPEVAKAKPLTEEEKQIQILIKKQSKTLKREILHNLDEAIPDSVSEEAVDKDSLKILLDRCKLLVKAYHAKNEAKPKNRPRKISHKPLNHPATAEEVNELIRGDEELSRPWMASQLTKIPPSGLLMRVTDESSMAKIWPHIGILSQSSIGSYHNRSWRRYELTLHADWGNKKKTSFISTTSCPLKFRDTWIKKFLKRDENKPSRNTVKLIFINAFARRDARYPILSMDDELRYYRVETPPSLPRDIYIDEYILPFRVSPDQIVGTYCWLEVEKWMIENDAGFQTWFQSVVIPAFQEHEAARKEGRPVREKAGCPCCGTGEST